MHASDVTKILDQCIAKQRVPGLQYVVVNVERPLFEYAGGWSGIKGGKAMTLDTTMMAYSMTKTLTAVAILQLVERGKIHLDDRLEHHLPYVPYQGHGITIKHLLNHTSGIANPIPLRWVHLTEDHAGFNECAALSLVLKENTKLLFTPGKQYSYSNIGYWLLGKVIENSTQGTYSHYMREHILVPLALAPTQMGYVIPDPENHAHGYLAKYSLLNLLKGLVTDAKFWGGYEGKWLRLKDHYLNGPSFGGLVGSARAFSCFLQDQLRTASVIVGPQAKLLLETRQTTSAGAVIPMTLGWHAGVAPDGDYFFKEGGGGGFHSEMRLYPSRGIASVVMANSTGFNSSAFLNRMDRLAHPIA